MDGSQQGMLLGRADKAGDAENVGFLARKRRKEQKIRELGGRDDPNSSTEKLTELEQEIEEWKKKLEILQREYQNLPGFTKINMALDQEKDGRLLLARITDE